MEVHTLAVCGGCGRTRDADNFYRNATTADGLDYRCKFCAKQRLKRYKPNPIPQQRKRESPYRKAADRLQLVREALLVGDVERALGVVERTLSDWRV